MRSRIYLLIGLTIGLAAVLGISQLFVKPYQFQGSLIEPPIPAADFTLNDQDNGTFTLSSQRGKIVLLFFGYTNCPDVCPTTLADYKYMIDALEEQSSDVRFVFVTVDPERDTSSELKSYVGFFSPEIIGLTGDEVTLESVRNSYGIWAEKQPTKENSKNYAVDHTARIFLIDQEGNLRLTYPFGFERERLVSDILHLLDESK